MAGRRYSGKNTVENCRSIDVLRWNSLGYFRSPMRFSWTWTYDNGEVASVNVETQHSSVTLRYRARSYEEDWSNVEQQVPIDWKPCLDGRKRPWFICSVYANGVYCERRVRKLYGAGRLFACRHCYNLAYASQHESLRYRGLGKARKIRARLGGSPNMLEEFPEKPKGMHWRTYDRLRATHDVAYMRSMQGLS
jgi:hypothetical protein